MFLVIDNSVDSELKLSIFLNTKWVHKILYFSRTGLLESIKNFLESYQKNWIDLKGVAVVVGKGRFTATRVATTIANALAMSLHIPVLTIDEFNVDLSTKLSQAKAGIYVSALYSAPANIGIKK
jgi:tRNA A37 threonylcarbamoyladenosine modification protein TsaB